MRHHVTFPFTPSHSSRGQRVNRRLQTPMDKPRSLSLDGHPPSRPNTKQNGVMAEAEEDSRESNAASVPRSKSRSFFKSLRRRFQGSRKQHREKVGGGGGEKVCNTSPSSLAVDRASTLPATSSKRSQDFGDDVPGGNHYASSSILPSTRRRVPLSGTTHSNCQRTSDPIQLSEANSIEDLDIDLRQPKPPPYFHSMDDGGPIYDTTAVARAFGPLRDVGRWFSHEQERRRQFQSRPQLPVPPPRRNGEENGTGVGDYEEDVVYTRVAPLCAENHGQSVRSGLKSLSMHGWYWGPLTRQEAEEKLHNTPDGTFLVRDSSDDRYLLSVTFRSQGRTLHTRIEYFNGRFSFYHHLEADGYESVVELIEQSVEDSRDGVFCFSRSRGPNARSYPVRLTHPLSRFIRVRSLQHHCRFVIRQLTRFDLIRQLPLPTGMKGFLEESKY
eukprot:m.17137 g.17137  ORF g.17137 m.17137 type:complete len:442 (+) comp27340_c0_seq1:1132-2457(+)